MSFAKSWRKSAVHVFIGIAVAVFAHFSVKAEASLARHYAVHLMPLDSLPSAE